MRKFRQLIRTALGAFFTTVVATFLLSAKTPFAHAQAGDTPIDVTPSREIDENLFLVRALEVTYGRWPRNTTDSSELEPWLAATKVRTSRLRATIKDRKLDETVGRLYEECLATLEAYETYLANLGAIDRHAVERAEADSTGVMQTAFKVSFDTASEARRQGASGADSVGAGIVAGLIGAAFDDYQRGQTRNEATRTALQAEARKLNAVWNDTIASAEIAVERLTETYKWSLGEAGFDGFSSQKMGDFLKRRPRDPFLRVANAEIRVDDETPAAVMADARVCVDAARLVPQGRAYDCYRAEFLAAAAELSLLACSRQLHHFEYSSGPAESAEDAVRICMTLLACDPTDATGTGNMLLARALAFGGRYEEAIGAANKAVDGWKGNPYFCYRYARLMSLTNKVALAFDWLAYSYRQGFSDVAVARDDADLSVIRTAAPDRFRELTTVKSSFHIKFGVFNDDVIIRNDSPFELTNVRVDLVVKKGNRTWKPDLRVASVKPGASHTFANVVSIPGSSYDSATATLYSDQGVD